MSEPSFDASSDPAGNVPPAADSDRQPSPFLGIRFECCRTYARIYRNKERTAYTGRCPTCRAIVNVPIGSDGTSTRFFKAN